MWPSTPNTLEEIRKNFEEETSTFSADPERTKILWEISILKAQIIVTADDLSRLQDTIKSFYNQKNITTSTIASRLDTLKANLTERSTTPPKNFDEMVKFLESKQWEKGWAESIFLLAVPLLKHLPEGAQEWAFEAIQKFTTFQQAMGALSRETQLVQEIRRSGLEYTSLTSQIFAEDGIVGTLTEWWGTGQTKKSLQNTGFKKLLAVNNTLVPPVYYFQVENFWKKDGKEGKTGVMRIPGWAYLWWETGISRLKSDLVSPTWITKQIEWSIGFLETNDFSISSISQKESKAQFHKVDTSIFFGLGDGASYRISWVADIWAAKMQALPEYESIIRPWLFPSDMEKTVSLGKEQVPSLVN